MKSQFKLCSRPKLRLGRVVAAIVGAVLLASGCSSSPSEPTGPPTDLRTVTVRIEGGGSVTSVPSGLSCEGGTCRANFPPGWQIALYASAREGWTLSDWQGDCRGNDNPCHLTTDQARTVTVTFRR